MVRQRPISFPLAALLVASAQPVLADTIVIDARDQGPLRRLTYTGKLLSLNQRTGVVEFAYVKGETDRVLEVHFTRIESLSIDDLGEPTTLSSPAHLQRPLTPAASRLRTIEFMNTNAFAEDYPDVRWDLKKPPGALATGAIQAVSSDFVTIEAKRAKEKGFIITDVERANFRKWRR